MTFLGGTPTCLHVIHQHTSHDGHWIRMSNSMICLCLCRRRENGSRKWKMQEEPRSRAEKLSGSRRRLMSLLSPLWMTKSLP